MLEELYRQSEFYRQEKQSEAAQIRRSREVIHDIRRSPQRHALPRRDNRDKQNML